MTAEQSEQISGTFERERHRLRNFIRRRIPNEWEVEDILQDVFYELVEAYQLAQPIEHMGAWLFRVARNRITDFFRKKKPIAESETEHLSLEELLPSPDAGPEAAYARRILLEEIDSALKELPAAQREVFVAHEIEGRAFKELSAATGVSVKTLLSRKHYAVLYLRRRLQAIYEQFGPRGTQKH